MWRTPDGFAKWTLEGNLYLHLEGPAQSVDYDEERSLQRNWDYFRSGLLFLLLAVAYRILFQVIKAIIDSSLFSQVA